MGSCLTDRDHTQQILLLPVNNITQLRTAPLRKKEKLNKIKVNTFYHDFVVKGVCFYG